MTEKVLKTGIGIVGLPGAGKSIVSEVGREKNIPTIVMGDIVRQFCIDEGLEINSENVGACMVKIREKEGMDAVAKRVLPKILELKEEVVIIDGLRSYEEVEFFRKKMKRFIVIAIHASPRVRYARIQKRRRFDDAQKFREFQERDFREINAGIAKIIVLADIMFINEGKIRPLKRRLSKVLQLIKDGRWR
ncbi:MAG: AAA family ATPase [Candidatus Helarchaeota archaeon]